MCVKKDLVVIVDIIADSTCTVIALFHNSQIKQFGQSCVQRFCAPAQEFLFSRFFSFLSMYPMIAPTNKKSK